MLFIGNTHAVMEVPGSSRSCQNSDEKLRNDEECQLSKASALRELEKARVRECQMEKTVRWWTVCTAGWRKKWSKLRQENEDLRKQIKAFKAQLNDMTQDCTTLNSKLEIFNAHNTYLKTEINKLLLKYEDENNERIQEILKTPEVVKQNHFVCTNCRISKESPKTLENTIETPDAENQLFPENDEKYSLLDESSNEGKNVEMLTEMIPKIFGELQMLKGEFVKNNDGTNCKDLPELFVTSDQIAQLKIYALSKQLDKEKADKKKILKKLEQANEEISKMNNAFKDAKLDEMFSHEDAQMSFEALSLSDEE